MRVLIACEFSAVVREAFRRRGHDAWSCDLLDTEVPGPHLKGDVRNHLRDGWDMMIAHPECTFLTVANTYIRRGCSKYTPAQAMEFRELAVSFFMELAGAPIDRISIENPVGIMSTRWRKPDQIIHPWQFGEDASKATCLWNKNLPLLRPTNVLAGGRKARRANQTASGQNRLPPSARD